MAVAQIRRWILEQEAAEDLLRPLHVAADDAERLPGERQRQQIGKMRAAARRPREMLGNERGVDPPGKFGETPQVARVEPFGAAERERNAVQRDRIVAADRFQVGERLFSPPPSLSLPPPPTPRRPPAPP